MDSDYSKEEKSLREIEKLFERQEGRKDVQPLYDSMSEMLVSSFFDIPRQRLHVIYELLTYIKEAKWDVEPQMLGYTDASEKLSRVTKDLKELVGQRMNPYELVDRFIFLYRFLLLTFIQIDFLFTSVVSLSTNFMISTKKLLGENNEDLA